MTFSTLLDVCIDENEHQLAQVAAKRLFCCAAAPGCAAGCAALVASALESCQSTVENRESSEPHDEAEPGIRGLSQLFRRLRSQALLSCKEKEKKRNPLLLEALHSSAREGAEVALEQMQESDVKMNCVLLTSASRLLLERLDSHVQWRRGETSIFLYIRRF